MGLLDKLWDDVLAGPQPEHGLGRLRRKLKVPEGMVEVEEAKRMVERRQSSEFNSQQNELPRVTQSITIAKPPPLRIDSLDPDNIGSTPSTPGAASTPTSSSIVGSPSVFDRERYFPRAASLPSSPAMASHGARERENARASLFHSGNKKGLKESSSEKFDKQAPSSPTVYDWVVLSALDR